MKIQKIPAFCRGSDEAMRKSVEYGGQFYPLDRILWCYINDGDRNGQLAFVTPGKHEGDDVIIEYMVGDNLKQIQVVDTLPSPDSAQTEVFYVLGTAVYLWNGSAYLPIIDVEDLENRVSSLETSSASYAEEIAAIQAGLDDYTAFKEATTLDITNLSNALSNTQADLSAITSRVTTTETAIASLDTRVTATEGDIADLNSTIVMHTDSIATNTEDISAIDDRVTTTETDISTLQTDVSSAQTDITNLQTQATATAEDVGSLADNLTNNYYTSSDTDNAIDEAISEAMEFEDLG